MSEKEAATMSGLDVFLNRMRILLNIDYPQFAKAVMDGQSGIPKGFPLDDPEKMWPAFQINPWRWMICAPTLQAAEVFKIILAREPICK